MKMKFNKTSLSLDFFLVVQYGHQFLHVICDMCKTYCGRIWSLHSISKQDELETRLRVTTNVVFHLK